MRVLVFMVLLPWVRVGSMTRLGTWKQDRGYNLMLSGLLRPAQGVSLAGERHHEYVTLEHLLLALCEDTDAMAVMRAWR